MTTYLGTCAPAGEAISIYRAIGRRAVTAAVDDLFGRLLADPARTGPSTEAPTRPRVARPYRNSAARAKRDASTRGHSIPQS
jgi:hypothetical protein